MNNLFTGTLLTSLPDVKSYIDLVEYDIAVARKNGNKTFMRIISEFDVHPDMSEKVQSYINRSKYCEVSFIEVNGRMQREQKFYQDITLISTLN